MCVGGWGRLVLALLAWQAWAHLEAVVLCWPKTSRSLACLTHLLAVDRRALLQCLEAALLVSQLVGDATLLLVLLAHNLLALFDQTALLLLLIDRLHDRPKEDRGQAAPQPDLRQARNAAPTTRTLRHAL